ncbi:hypothetical protein J2046_006622 [Rhizobium petrolearium]|uniref:Uncharacterized protein n=1 Tax=Neorhizobium phenanthreniclasticum TaxID=3157917 RepID=A0ABV0MCR4_9HYPH|nr:hypothetical protein [Neorhizobium petrolearium]MBP1848331.1 hypothetical protein [Neorhizobium petrolearium]
MAEKKGQLQSEDRNGNRKPDGRPRSGKRTPEDRDHKPGKENLSNQCPSFHISPEHERVRFPLPWKRHLSPFDALPLPATRGLRGALSLTRFEPFPEINFC